MLAADRLLVASFEADSNRFPLGRDCLVYSGRAYKCRAPSAST
jgi:hypothetical protein